MLQNFKEDEEPLLRNEGMKDAPTWDLSSQDEDLTRQDMPTVIALIAQFIIYIIVFLGYAKWYDQVDDADDRKHNVFFNKNDSPKSLLLAGLQICASLVALRVVVAIRRKAGPKFEFKRNPEQRGYTVVMILCIIGGILKATTKAEAGLVTAAGCIDLITTFLLATTEMMRKQSSTGRRSVIQKDDKMPDSAGVPYDDMPSRLVVICHQVYQACWAIFQTVAFVGHFQDGQPPTALNLILIPLILANVRFRTFSFAKILEGYNLRFMSTETIWVANAGLFMLVMAIVFFYSTFHKSFEFANTFQMAILGLDTAGLLSISAISIVHCYFGITILIGVARNSNYTGPDVRHNLLSILLRYEYVPYHLLAFYTMLYIGYRMMVSESGYADGKYEFVGVHVVVSRVVMIVEVLFSVVFCTLFSFMPPIARSNHEYHQIIRFGWIVMFAQVFFATETIIAFIAYLANDDETTGKVSLFVGFGLLPVLVYRLDTFLKLAYKFLNARRVNLFTGQYHKSELYVGTRFLDEDASPSPTNAASAALPPSATSSSASSASGSSLGSTNKHSINNANDLL